MSEINLYHGDCMEAMAQMPDKCYELAIVDPPYGINIASAGKIGNCNPFGGKKSFGIKNTRKTIIPSKDYGKKKWDKNSPLENYFNELIRVSQNQIIWGANHFISKIAIDSPCWLIWNKQNSGNYADCEIAWTSFNSVVKMFDFRWNGMLQGDMKNKQTRIHPTQKPIQLYKWLLANYAKPGDKILDTHGGSMSIAIACHDMGFALDLWEIDKDYYDAGVKRFGTHKSQLQIQFA